MASLTLTSTLLMGLLLLLVAVGVSRLRHWRPAYRASLAGRGEAVADVARRGEDAWILTFSAVAVAFGLGAVAVVSGAEIGVTLPDSFWGQFGLALLPFLVLLTAMVVGGVYTTLRARGHGQAFATGAGIGVLGTLLVLGIAVKLVLGV